MRDPRISTRAPRPATDGLRAGFTLIEVMLATLLVGTMLVAASSALGMAGVAKESRRDVPVTALDLAREVHALTMLLPRAPGTGTPAASGSGVQVLEDLDGARFSPPIDAGRQALSGASGWRQSVSLQRRLLAAPEAPVPSGEAGEALGTADWIYALTVTVDESGETKGSYTWWIEP